MANNKDLLLESLDGDLLIGPNGDFVIRISTPQEEHDIIEYFPGEIHQFSNVGVGINSYINGQVNGLQNIVKKQLISDGLIVNKLVININSNSQLTIDVNCTRR